MCAHAPAPLVQLKGYFGTEGFITSVRTEDLKYAWQFVKAGAKGCKISIPFTTFLFSSQQLMV